MANLQRELSHLRLAIQERLTAGQGAAEVARALGVSKGMAYTVQRLLKAGEEVSAADEEVPSNMSWLEVSRRLDVLIQRLTDEDGPL